MNSQLLSPGLAASPYQRWHRYFLRNGGAPAAFPWNHPYRLSAPEVRAVGHSIQQFQLGEYARGRGLRRRAASDPLLGSDRWFLEALDLFIAEEQGHSGMLGRFLDREGIPRLTDNWLDGAFRGLRKLAGLEVCVTVLVTAEILAVPFYQALRDATRSPLLRNICTRILRDEAAHLKYQALTIALVRRRASKLGRRVRRFCHWTLLHGTALLVWQQHRRVFSAAGWSFSHFSRGARQWFGFLQNSIDVF